MAGAERPHASIQGAGESAEPRLARCAASGVLCLSEWRVVLQVTSSVSSQVWVTANTVAGEGTPSPRITAIPNPKPNYTPAAVGGGRTWHVGVGAGVTLGCRGLGSPSPSTSWTRGGVAVTSGQLMQLLPGGDLHLTGEWRGTGARGGAN